MIIFKNISSWSLPDLLDIPFKIIIYFTLIGTLDKFQFGLLNIAMMIFSYQAISQIGIVDWLMYELPKKYALNVQSDSLIAESYSFVFFNQLILAIITMLMVFIFGNSSLFFKLACGAYLLHTIFYNNYLHRKLYLRFNHNFSKLLNIQLYHVSLKFILELSALYFFGIYAFLGVQALIFLIPILLFKANKNIKLYDPNWISNYKFLIFKGLPFFIVILMSTILANLDKWFIVGFFGIENFAIYSVGAFIITGIMILPGKILSIFIQYMKEMFTLSSDLNLNINRSFSINNVLIYFFACLSLLLNYLSGYLSVLIPEYQEVIPLLNLFLLASILKYGVSLTSNILYLIGKRALVAKIQILITLCYLIFLSIAINNFTDMSSVLLTMCCVLFVQIFINLVLVLMHQGALITHEIFKFFCITLSVLIFLYSYQLAQDKFLLFACFVSLTMISLLNIKQTWSNFAYLAYRRFS